MQSIVDDSGSQDQHEDTSDHRRDDALLGAGGRLRFRLRYEQIVDAGVTAACGSLCRRGRRRVRQPADYPWGTTSTSRPSRIWWTP